jgi:hypothetical protein
MVTARTTQEDPMRKLIVKLSAAAMIAATAAAALQGAASARDIPSSLIWHPQTSQPAPTHADPGLSFTTTMISYTPVSVAPGGLTAGDGYVIAGKVTRNRAPDGLSTAQCTYTDTAGPVLRVCTVDYALDNGLIVTSGYINGPGKGAPVTLVITGGTGAYAGARGYGTLQPTPAGSNVKLHLTG